MITEFCFTVPDKPGELSKITNILGTANVNIEGFSEVSSDAANASFRLVVNDPSKAESALSNAGIPFKKNQAFELNLPNKPGTLATLASKLGDAGINITSFYVTMQQKQVLGVDSVDAAKQLVSEFEA